MKLKKVIAAVTALAITAAAMPQLEPVFTVYAEGNGAENTSAEDSRAESLPALEMIAAPMPYEITATGSTTNYDYSYSDGEATITKYKGTDTNVVIPDTLGGYKVTAIGSYAFKNCTSLETVELNGSITAVNREAFIGCTSLSTVKFNDALTTIGYCTFKNCKMLEEAKFGANLTFIDSYAFEGCTELSVLEFTDTTDTKNTELNIGEGAFYKCEKLINIVFPNSLSAIGENAFADCTSLETVELNGSMTIIGGGAFYSCTSLTTVKFNDSLTTIGYNAFRDCEMLEEAKFGANLTAIGSCAFEGCKELSVLEFTDTTDTENTALQIYDSAFEKCERLKNIVFPNSLSAISHDAFTDCIRLKTVELNGSITTIDSRSFDGCTSLTTVKFNDALTTIGYCAFRNCEMLEEAKFGANLTAIDSCAFEGCKELSVLEFTDTTDTENTALKIGEDAFYKCEGLTNIVFPNSLSAISKGAFKDCIRLETVELNGNITTISGGHFVNNYGAFEGCTNLKTVKFNDDLTTIEDYAFYGCEMLEEAKFGANLTAIGDSAFGNCKSLNTITIPASVSIHYSAFNNSALKTVLCPDNSDSALWAIDNNYSVVLSPNDRVPPKHSRLDYDNSTFVMNKTGGYSTTLSYKFTELMPGEIKVKIPVYAELKSILINGKATEDYTVKDEHIFIPVNDTEGKITINFEQNNGLLMPTYATVTYDKGSVTDIIGIINENTVCNSETGITVSLPEGSAASELEVVKTESDENTVGYNITLKDKDGNEVQPGGTVTVKIPVPYGFDSENCKVYRKEANGTYTDMKAELIDGFLVFTTDHFSEYAVSTENLGVNIMLGNINGDDKISTVDAKWVLQAISGSRTLTEEQKAAADVNKDGKITTVDAKWILQAVSGSRVL